MYKYCLLSVNVRIQFSFTWLWNLQFSI